MDNHGPRWAEWINFGLEKTWNMDEQNWLKTYKTQKEKKEKKSKMW